MQSAADKIQWMNTWPEYVRGHIVSKSAAQLIQSFLLNTFTSSSTNDNSESEADASEDDPDVPPLKLSLQKFDHLLRTSKADDILLPNDEDDQKKNWVQN